MELTRAEYIKIRKNLDLKIIPTELLFHILKDFFIVSLLASIWKIDALSSLKIISSPLLTVLIFRSFAIMHEASHSAITKNRFINNVFGVFYSGIALLPFEQWKSGHMEHHYWSGNLEKDPVMGLLRAFPKFPKWLQLTMRLGWKAWIPVVSVAQHTVFWIISVRHFTREKLNFLRAASLITPIALWTLVLTLSSSEFTLYVTLPGLVLYLLATEIVNLPHHLQLVEIIGDKKFHAWEQYATARTCVYPRWFARNIALNFNFHSAHHMFPDVPWYHLEKLHHAIHEKINDRLMMDVNMGWNLTNRKRSFAKVLYSEPKTSTQIAA